MEKKNNTFSEIAAKYSDQEIATIISAPGDYSRLIVDACRNEAAKRGIRKEVSTAVSEDKSYLYVTEVRSLLKSGKSREECEQFLLEKGLNKNQVYKIMNTASQSPVKHIKGPYEDKDHYGLKIGTVLLLAVLTIKLLIRFI